MAPKRYPQILVFDEKHGDDTYIVNSPEEFHRIAVAKIRARANYGEFGEIDPAKIEKERDRAVKRLIESSGVPVESAPTTLEGLKALGEGTDEELAAKLFAVELSVFQAFPKVIKEQSLQGAAKYIKTLPRTLSDYENELNEARSIDLIVKSERAEELTTSYRGRSYNLAVWILESRQDYQYEGYDLDVPRVAPTAEELEAERTK